MNKDTISTQTEKKTLGTVAKVIGILGLGYLAYSKRDRIQNGVSAVKQKTNDLVEPISENIKEKSDQFQDFLQNKTQNATEAVNALSNQIEDKYHQLQGSSKEAYVNALNSLHDKIKNIDKSVVKHTEKIDALRQPSKNEGHEINNKSSGIH